MKVILILITILTFASLGLSEASSDRERDILNIHVSEFSVQHLRRLDALLKLGKEARIPLGIEYVGRSMLEESVTFTAHNASVKALLDRIVPKHQGFRAYTKFGTLVVTHSSVRDGASNLFLKLMPDYKLNRAATLPEASLLLKMNLQLVMNPEIKGFLGDYSSASSGATLEPFMLQNTSVEDILDILVAKAGGVAWVAQAPPTKLGKLPKRGLWELVFYEQIPADYASTLASAFDQ